MPSTHLLTVALVAALIGACGDDPPASTTALRCSDEATPTQLASKLDDDDGDGNPIDEDFPDIDDEDDDIADHAWVRDESGVYHLFFHSESLNQANGIEHYTSPDLQHLDYAGVALTVNPGAWDGTALWAPHVVEHDGVYYMFYTGVSGTGPDAIQRIGLATSTDLFAWTRLPVNRCGGTTGDGCVYECNESWTTWGGPGGSFNQQCRDAFVMWDADAQRWLMFATAKSTNLAGVVTVASATDLSAWTGAGYLDATRRLATGTGAQATGGQCENAFVVTSGATHFLLFTDWQDPEDSLSVANPRTTVQYATSSSLSIDAAGSANWIYRGYTPDPGVNATEVIDRPRDNPRWLASQSISSRLSGVPKPQRRQLRLKCVTWGEDGTIETLNWGPTPIDAGASPYGPPRR